MIRTTEEAQTVLEVVLKKQSTGTALDLTGGSATFVYRIEGGDEVSRTMTITNGVAGTVRYEFADGELTAGILDGRVVPVTAAGKKLPAYRVRIPIEPAP